MDKQTTSQRQGRLFRIRLWAARRLRLLRQRIWLRRLRRLERLTREQLRTAWSLQKVTREMLELEESTQGNLSKSTWQTREMRRSRLEYLQQRQREYLLQLPLPMPLFSREQTQAWEEMQLATNQLTTLLQENRYTKG